MNFEPKDKKRIKGIIDRSKGDKAKAIKYAKVMANLIADSDKALRRALAAEDAGYDYLGKIFRHRVNVILGINVKQRLKEKVNNDYDD